MSWNKYKSLKSYNKDQINKFKIKFQFHRAILSSWAKKDRKLDPWSVLTMKDLPSGSLASQLKMVKHFFCIKSPDPHKFYKFGYKNAIKGAPVDFLTAPSTPSKEFGQNPKDLSSWIYDQKFETKNSLNFRSNFDSFIFGSF